MIETNNAPAMLALMAAITCSFSSFFIVVFPPFYYSALNALGSNLTAGLMVVQRVAPLK